MIHAAKVNQFGDIQNLPEEARCEHQQYMTIL